jgi:hypothetical protein
VGIGASIYRAPFFSQQYSKEAGAPIYRLPATPERPFNRAKIKFGRAGMTE